MDKLLEKITKTKSQKYRESVWVGRWAWSSVAVCDRLRGTEWNAQGWAPGSVGSFEEKPMGPVHKPVGELHCGLFTEICGWSSSTMPSNPSLRQLMGHPASALSASCLTRWFHCLPLPQCRRQAVEPTGHWIQMQQLPRWTSLGITTLKELGKVLSVCFVCMDGSMFSDVHSFVANMELTELGEALLNV